MTSLPALCVPQTAGPAGMMASLCCNTYGLKVLHVDEREGKTKAGRADGLQPRTLEVSFLDSCLPHLRCTSESHKLSGRGLAAGPTKHWRHQRGHVTDPRF